MKTQLSRYIHPILLLLTLLLVIFTNPAVANNLLKNPGFENGGKAGWWGDGVVSSSYARRGAKALTLRGNLARYPNLQQIVSVRGGKKYRFSGWLQVKGISFGNYGFRVSWRDANKKEIGTARYKFGATNRNTSYKKHTADLVAPAKARSVKFFLLANKANGIAYYDDLSITSLSGGSATTAQKTANTSNSTKTATQETAAANQATQTTISGSNLLSNPGFETGNKSSWQGDGLVSNNNVRSGKKALSLSGKPTGYPYLQQVISVKGGNKYRISGWLQTKGMSSGSYLFRVNWRDANKKEIKTARHNFGQTKRNTAYKQHIADLVAPTNAASVKIVLLANKANGTAYYDNVSIINLSNGTSTTKTSQQTAVNSSNTSATGTTNEPSAPEQNSQENSQVILSGTNLLNNPGFEAGSKTGWWGDGLVNSRSTRSGTKAFSLTGNPSNYPNLQQVAMVKAGKKYRFSGWLQTNGMSKGNYGFRVSWRDASKKEIKTARHNFGETRRNTLYTQHIADLVAPKNAVSAKLFLIANKANGTAYYDDISIIDLSKAVVTNVTQIAPPPPPPAETTLVANHDRIFAQQNNSLSFSLVANDKGFSSGTKITLKSTPSNGEVLLLSDGNVVYTPNQNYSGEDSFVYQLTSSSGNIAIADVSISVECTTGCGSKFTLTWNPSKSPNIVGYKVYVGHNTTAFNKNNAYEINNVNQFTYLASAKGKYYFAVKAVNNYGMESDYSEIVSAKF